MSEPSETEGIRAIVQEFARISKRRKRLRQVLWYIGAGTILPLGGLNFYLIPRVPFDHWSTTLVSALQMVIPFVTIVPSITMPLPSRRQKQIIEQLSRCDRVEAIGPLLSGLGLPSKAFQDVVMNALLALLPRVKSGDVVFLSDDGLLKLYEIVKSANHPLARTLSEQYDDLLVAILRAIGEVGDERVWEAVLNLATRDVTTDSQERIRQAAQECLPRLRERIERLEQERVGQHLLRPSNAPEALAEVLVRPAEGSTTTDPQQLLRPL